MANGDTKTNQYLNIAANGARADLPGETCCETRSQTLIREVAERIIDVEEEVDELKNNSDVVDIVDTYEDLENYSTSSLTDKDIIRVLNDESHGGESTYYRWSTSTNTWTYIGSAGSSGSTVTVLSTADYNWPTSSPNGVALWLMPSGIYVGPSNSSVHVYKVYNSDTYMGSGFSSFAIVKECEDTNSNRAIVAWYDGADGTQSRYYYSINANGSSYSSLPLLTSVTNNLTSTSTANALSANQGKVLKDLIDSIAVRAAGAPTTSTVGAVGTLYEDTTNGKLYICTDATNPYVWTEVGAGGSGPSVVQTTGTSTTDVMSQNATTSMVYADPATRQRVQVGSGSNALGFNAISVGYEAGATNTNAIALGRGSFTNSSGAIAIGFDSVGRAQDSVAVGHGAAVTNSSNYAVAIGSSSRSSASGSVSLGAYSSATEQGEINVGTSQTAYGFDGTNYRLISGVHDGESAHDAVTVGQINDLIDAINTATSSNIPHIGD